MTALFGVRDLWVLVLSFPGLPHTGFWVHGVLSHLWFWDAQNSDWPQPTNMLRHLMPVLKANPWLFACIRKTKANTDIWECCRTDRTSLPVSEVKGCNFTTCWSQREEHPSFPSDREFSNFSGAAGCLKICTSIPESCSFLPAHETS